MSTVHPGFNDGYAKRERKVRRRRPRQVEQQETQQVSSKNRILYVVGGVLASASGLMSAAFMSNKYNAEQENNAAMPVRVDTADTTDLHETSSVETVEPLVKPTKEAVASVMTEQPVETKTQGEAVRVPLTSEVAKLTEGYNVYMYKKAKDLEGDGIDAERDVLFLIETNKKEDRIVENLPTLLEGTSIEEAQLFLCKKFLEKKQAVHELNEALGITAEQREMIETVKSQVLSCPINEQSGIRTEMAGVTLYEYCSNMKILRIYQREMYETLAKTAKDPEQKAVYADIAATMQLGGMVDMDKVYALAGLEPENQN